MEARVLFNVTVNKPDTIDQGEQKTSCSDQTASAAAAIRAMSRNVKPISPSASW